MNREVKVIIPNMHEFRVFYSDNEGSVMFFKRDWVEVRDEHWKPSEEQMMKGAVDNVVSLDAGGFPFIEFGVGKYGLKVRDKVRVIVLKKED